MKEVLTRESMKGVFEAGTRESMKGVYEAGIDQGVNEGGE